MVDSAFLRTGVQVFPYKIHTVLTDNGMAFADLPKHRHGPTGDSPGAHIFGRVCADNDIEHRLTNLAILGPTGRACPRKGGGRANEPHDQ